MDQNDLPPQKWPETLLNGGSVNGRRILERDWSNTSLGPLENWPSELRSALSICLESLFPTYIYWGPDLIQFYNDAGSIVIGEKDRLKGLGFPAQEAFPELWPIIHPMFNQVMNEGKSIWVEDRLLPIIRYGFEEEAYFTFSYSPIRNEIGKVLGITCSAMETTKQVIGDRRLHLLHSMAVRFGNKPTLEETIEECMATLSSNRHDLPFAVLRLITPGTSLAKVAGAYGIKVPDRNIEGGDRDEAFHPALSEVIHKKAPVFVNELPPDVEVMPDFLGRNLPRSVYVLPLFLLGTDQLIGYLSVGLNPHRPFDEDYKSFLDLVATQIGAAFRNANLQQETIKRTQALSRDQIKRLGILLDASPDHVFMLDREGRYIYLNEATTDALVAQLKEHGREHESPLGQNGAEMGFDPEFLKKFTGEQKRAFQGETVSGEVLFPTSKGLREFEYILSPIHDDDDSINNLVGITRDVQELKTAIKVRDQFLSIASHELKTPLTSLKMHSQLRSRSLQKQIFTNFTPEKLAKMFSDDERQINRLNRLVDDMLDISRLSSGKLTVNPEPFDLRDLIQEVIERFQPQLESARVQIQLTLPDEIKVEWDRYRIEQVITNLITNALKYGAGNPIEVTAGESGGIIKIQVKDEGLGIAKEDLPRIFLQFERAVSGTDISGLGLGLFIVKQIVESHRGKIHVESEVGKGSCFTVELPLRFEA